MKDVRILFVGDSKRPTAQADRAGGTGKTSLILAVVKERFEPEVPPLSEEVVIPPDITAARVTTYIVDSSLRAQDESQIEEEMRKANVICVVYAVDDAASFQRLRTHWLPAIRRALGPGESRTHVPIVLVGNKIDTRSDDHDSCSLEKDIFPLMNDFKEVETCIECSAKRVANISELISFAQKAVLYPSYPLYDSSVRALKPAAVQALTRVFRLCDVDKDDILNDTELHAFQTACFNTPLPSSELGSLKEVVRGSCPEGVRDNGLTCAGFLFLNKLFIERGHLETTWAVLRRYGYLDNLSLNPSFTHPPYTAAFGGADGCSLVVGRDCAVELSAAGENFLRDVFRRFDKLTSEQLQELWSTAPTGDPWEVRGACLALLTGQDYLLPGPGGEVPTMTLDRFMLLWTLFVLDHPNRALEYFAYLGFRVYNEDGGPADSVASAVAVQRSRRIDREAGYTTRTVFMVAVFGQVNSGKARRLPVQCSRLQSSLLQHAGGRLLVHSPQTGQKTAVASVTTKSSTVNLVLREYAVAGADADVVSSASFGDHGDVALFLYDQSDAYSFQYAANLHSKITEPRPTCIFVATKPDLPTQRQDFPETPEEYCAKRGLAPPLAATQDFSNVLSVVAEHCLSPRRKTAPTRPSNYSIVQGLAQIALVFGAVAAAVLAYRYARRR